MNINLRSCSVLAALLVMLATWLATAQGQQETAFIEVLVKNKKPISVGFSAQELKNAESDPKYVRKKLIDKAGKTAECSEPQNIGEGIWACRDGTILRTKDDVLKKVLTKLYR